MSIIPSDLDGIIDDEEFEDENNVPQDEEDILEDD